MTPVDRSSLVPISSLLLIDDDPTCDPLRDLVASLDDVLKLPAAPPVHVTRELRSPPGFDAEYNSSDGVPGYIWISRRAENPEFSFLHEIGHFIDEQALGHGSYFASISDPRLQRWRMETDGTAEVIRLRKLIIDPEPRYVIIGSDGRAQTVPVFMDYVTYLLLPQELFARAVAQFLTEVNAANTLTEQLRWYVQAPTAEIYPRQWADSEFRPIAHALLNLFISFGWMSEP